ncbi:antibiotic biosynthesis monooxygenase family protein [Pseudomonas sp. Irchel 3E20]|uniref:antibiotic biosynthesis monooxygenase family protein n=1 Tax=Pseudomonas sp. Irchel 3E20 TaxID=2008983 RepID=UPI000BA38812|nr:antibiotic biosynthesis monooxygenase family protein [Pseudomonas sp. Irchel 3E20]
MTMPLPVSHMALVRARAGRSMDLGARLSSLIEPTLGAPGCLHFALQHSLCDPDLWQVCGFWRDAQAMTAHFNSPALNVFAQLVQDGVVERLDFHTFSEVSRPQDMQRLAG